MPQMNLKLYTKEFVSMAQEFVEVTSPLIRNRTINIMNLDAIIIASTDKTRIGKFHQGAKEVIETGRPVEIRKDMLDRYPGAKEGYNLPIMDHGEMIGVVGMYGEENELQDAANLLCLYVTQYFRCQIERERIKTEDAIRNQLLDLFLLGDKEMEPKIERLKARAQIRLHFPMVVIMAKEIENIEAENATSSISPTLRQFTDFEKAYWPDNIYAIRDENIVILHSLQISDNSNRYDEDMLFHWQKEYPQIVFAISDIASCIEDIPCFYKETKLLLEVGKGSIRRMDDFSSRTEVYLQDIMKSGGERYIRSLLDKLKNSATSEQMEALLQTADAYFEAAGSVNTAATILKIHKNTLQYRLHHLFEIVGLDEATPFERELIVKLMLLSHKK